MKRIPLYVAMIGFTMVLLQNCGSSAVEPVEGQASTFDLIQDQILTPSCATVGCHNAITDASYKQHGLILTKGNSLKALLNIVPKNANAIKENLLLVKPFSAQESLLYHKLNWLGSVHHTGKNYGSPMPLGSTALYAGQIEFIKRWINAGAGQTGQLADKALLLDRTPSVSTNPNDFTPLAKPAEGTGYQLAIDRFDVYPNFEREIFVRKEVGNKTEVYVNSFELKSRSNSHHMVIYDFRDKNLLPSLNSIRDLRNRDNTLNIGTVLSMSNHVFLAGGSDSQMSYTFPKGTAIKIPAGASVDLNPHYFNKTNDVLYGQNYVNFYTVPSSEVKNVVQTLDLQNSNIPVAAGQTVTHNKKFTFSKARYIVALTSHTHKFGERFKIKIAGGKRNGEVIYETTDWEHPATINFDIPIRLEAGEGLESEITYKNTSQKSVNFGLTSDDEMGIIFGYYYEAP
jgi:hypothetical protein